MTCGNLTYARAKDVIIVSSKEIVDMHRMPRKINKSALRIIIIYRMLLFSTFTIKVQAPIQLLFVDLLLLRISYGFCIILARAFILYGFTFGDFSPFSIIELWLCMYTNVHVSFDLPLFLYVPCLNVEKAKYSKMSAFGMLVVSSVLLFNLTIASLIHSNVW